MLHERGFGIDLTELLLGACDYIFAFIEDDCAGACCALVYCQNVFHNGIIIPRGEKNNPSRIIKAERGIL